MLIILYKKEKSQRRYRSQWFEEIKGKGGGDTVEKELYDFEKTSNKAVDSLKPKKTET
jgi:hypothetical protein